MARLSVIDPTQLPDLQVLETLDAEAILSARMQRLKSDWAANDPPAAALYDVENLEFDPIKINQETSTYFELLLRDRVNQAAKSVTLAFATGSDVDAIASRYPGGVPRIAGESDDDYKLRVWLSPNTLAPNGVEESYVFWAMSADPSLRDATATATEGEADIYLTIMADGSAFSYDDVNDVFSTFPNPAPTTAQIKTVDDYTRSYGRKAMTDVLHTLPPKQVFVDYEINVWTFPGWDSGLLLKQVKKAFAAFVEKQRWLGYSHVREAAEGALITSGIYKAQVVSPATDIVVTPRNVVVVRSVKFNYMGQGGYPALEPVNS